MRGSMFSEFLATMDTDPMETGSSRVLELIGRRLLATPDDAVNLLTEVGCRDTDDEPDERLIHLLGTALDEGRMARENGQRRGADFIDRLEAELDRMATDEALTPSGCLALSGCWVRAGLAAPDALASMPALPGEMPLELQGDDLEQAEALFDELFGELVEASEGSASAAHAMFAEMLPTVPAEARYALIRIAVARPDELLAELGCAWLLDADERIREGAIDGLLDRLKADRLSALILSRLTILRSWLPDRALKGRLDDLQRDAMRAGIGGTARETKPKIHRLFASMIDGSGSQSIVAAVQSGSSRAVALVLLKQGFGVKDGYTIACRSATEQRNLIAQITAEIDTFDVPQDYMFDAISLALGEGLEAGRAPVPGLVDVAEACGLTALRPVPSGLDDVLAMADPECQITKLSVQARGRLIMASQTWDMDFPMLDSWYEDSDATIEVLEAATSPTSCKRGLWKALEARRQHWAMVIARNALLLQAAGKDTADEFLAVAAALADGRDLKKTPVMQHVFEHSLEVWMERRDEVGGFYDEPDLLFDEEPLPFESLPMPDIQAEKTGELARLLKPADLSETWMEGYLMGVCSAPIFVNPGNWIEPLLDLVGDTLTSDAKLQRFLDLLMLRYNTAQSRLQAPDDPSLVPSDFGFIPDWADGYLTAWEANEAFWPVKALGKQGHAMRKLLEAATDGRIDPLAFSTTLPAWMRQQRAAQMD